jgi:outer membrane immunogenic protein
MFRTGNTSVFGDIEMRTKFILTALALIGATSIASAADLPARTYTKAPVMPVQVFNWTGFYIGGFVGGAFDDRNATATDPSSPAGALYNGGNIVNSYGLNSSFIGGGTVGYNWQTPGSNFVFGLEGEAGYLNLHRSQQDINAINSGFAFPDSINSSHIGDAYGVIAGRVGWAADRALFYAKGGVAFVGNSYNFNDSCSTGGCGASTLFLGHSDTQVTYAVGAGIEYAFTNNWSLKGEYLYLGTRRTFTQSGVAGGGLAGTVETNTASEPGVHTAKIGINYRFGGPILAKY